MQRYHVADVYVGTETGKKSDKVKREQELSKKLGKASLTIDNCAHFFISKVRTHKFQEHYTCSKEYTSVHTSCSNSTKGLCCSDRRMEQEQTGLC